MEISKIAYQEDVTIIRTDDRGLSSNRDNFGEIHSRADQELQQIVSKQVRILSGTDLVLNKFENVLEMIKAFLSYFLGNLLKNNSSLISVG